MTGRLCRVDLQPLRRGADDLQVSVPTAEDHLRQADLLLQLRRPAGAVRAATLAVAAEPENARAWGCLAGCLDECGDHAGALAAITRAVSLEPSEADWHLQTSRSLSALNIVRGSIEAAEEAVRLAPWNSDTYAQLATALAARGHGGRVFALQLPGDLRKAEQHAQRAISLSTGSVTAQFAAAFVATAAGRHRVARRRYLQVLRLDPQNASAINNLAAVDMHRLRLGRSGAGFVRALQTDPSLDLARTNVSKSVHLQLGCLQAVIWAVYLWFVVAAISDPTQREPDGGGRRLAWAALLITVSIAAAAASISRGNRSVRGFTTHLLRTRRTLWFAGGLDAVLLACLALGTGGSRTSIELLLLGLATMPPAALCLALSSRRDAG